MEKRLCRREYWSNDPRQGVGEGCVGGEVGAWRRRNGAVLGRKCVWTDREWCCVGRGVMMCQTGSSAVLGREIITPVCQARLSARRKASLMNASLNAGERAAQLVNYSWLRISSNDA